MHAYMHACMHACMHAWNTCRNKNKFKLFFTFKMMGRIPGGTAIPGQPVVKPEQAPES